MTNELPTVLLFGFIGLCVVFVSYVICYYTSVLLIMPIVYRVQDCDGRGPFKPGFSSVWVKERPDHDNLHPWFIEFGRVDKKVLTGEVCGRACLTKEQLRRWFTKSEYKKLKKHGYKAVKMEVNRIIAESDIQCFVGRAKPFNEAITTIKLY